MKLQTRSSVVPEHDMGRSDVTLSPQDVAFAAGLIESVHRADAKERRRLLLVEIHCRVDPGVHDA